MNAEWVPKNCRLYLTFDNGTWTGSLRLRHDYLGYLVRAVEAQSPSAAIEAVRVAYFDGLKRLDEWRRQRDNRHYYFAASQEACK